MATTPQAAPRFKCGHERANGEPCAVSVKVEGARCSTHSEENLRAIASRAIDLEARMLPHIAQLEATAKERQYACNDAERELHELSKEKDEIEDEINALRELAAQSKATGRMARLLALAEEIVLVDATPEQVALADSRRELAKELRLFSGYAAASAEKQKSADESDWPGQRKSRPRKRAAPAKPANESYYEKYGESDSGRHARFVTTSPRRRVDGARFRVATGKSISTSIGEMLCAGDDVVARDLSGGAAKLDELAALGHVVKIGSGIAVDGEIQRDEVLVSLWARTVVRGTILERLPSGKLDVWRGDEGSDPVAVLTYDVTSSAPGDIAIRALVRGEVNRERLITLTGDPVTDDAVERLRKTGIVARRVISI